MKKYYSVLKFILRIVIVQIILAVGVVANSAEPPMLTVTVVSPPQSLKLSLRFEGNQQLQTVVIEGYQKAWETYYIFYRHDVPFHNSEIEKITLVVESEKDYFEVNVPKEIFCTHNTRLQLDLKKQVMREADNTLRNSLLVVMRISLTLLIEGSIFYWFGFRNKRSWVSFLAINLMTQWWLNVLLLSSTLDGYLVLGIFLLEIIILMVEMIAFLCLIKERRKRRRIAYVIVANVVSFILGGLVIVYLPI